MPHCDYCKKEVDYNDGPIIEIRAVLNNKSDIIKLSHYRCWMGVDKIPVTM